MSSSQFYIVFTEHGQQGGVKLSYIYIVFDRRWVPSNRTAEPHLFLCDSLRDFSWHATMSHHQSINTCHISIPLRLIPVVVSLYLNLTHPTSAFSLTHQCSSSRLQHLAHGHINISHIRFFSPTQQHHSRLNHFRIDFMDNEFKKINWIAY
jgi:hypothetical protein